MMALIWVGLGLVLAIKLIRALGWNYAEVLVVGTLVMWVLGELQR